MGAKPLELILRRRLLAVLGPALVAVGVATVLVVRVSLEREGEDAARGRAAAALQMLERELGAGDDLQTAIDEVTPAMEAEGVRVWLERGGVTSRAPPEDAARDVPLGACKTTRDAARERWCVCAVGDAETRAVATLSMKTHDEVLSAVAAWATLAVLAALFVAALAARAALRAPLASVRALADWTEALAAGERPIPAPEAASAASAEIARLTATFEALVERLFEALDRERAASAHIAHELRTPLTAMRAELESLAAHEPLARRLIDDAERLSRAIEAILFLSQARGARAAGGAPRTIVNVADVARELTPARVTVEAPDEALVAGDEPLIALALRNILENADKYAGGATRVVVQNDGGVVTLLVRDAGDGLDASACAHMFERHWRGTSTATGTGLGLALVRAVAERHAGEAVARPNPEGRGLEVGVRLGAVVGWHA